jgi:thioredoxin 1
MKINKLLIGISLGIILTFSCKSQSSKENTSKTTEAKPNSGIEHLTAASFKQKVFNYEINKEWKFIGKNPAIIDFYADWCGPCKMVAPTVAEIAEKYKGKVDVYKINVDNEKELASAFGISSIPSILFIPVNAQPQMSTGVMSKDDFEKMIGEVLKIK